MSELLSKHCLRILSIIDKISLPMQTQTELTEKNEKYLFIQQNKLKSFLIPFLRCVYLGNPILRRRSRNKKTKQSYKGKKK